MPCRHLLETARRTPLCWCLSVAQRTIVCCTGNLQRSDCNCVDAVLAATMLWEALTPVSVVWGLVLPLVVNWVVYDRLIMNPIVVGLMLMLPYKFFPGVSFRWL